MMLEVSKLKAKTCFIRRMPTTHAKSPRTQRPLYFAGSNEIHRGMVLHEKWFDFDLAQYHMHEINHFGS
jgi:hypothetical protein